MSYLTLENGTGLLLTEAGTGYLELELDSIIVADDWSPAYILSAGMAKQRQLPVPRRQLVLAGDVEAPAELDDVWAALVAILVDD